jgi:hypothetical protein
MEARMAVASGQPNPLAPVNPAIPLRTGTTASPTTPLSGAHDTVESRLRYAELDNRSRNHASRVNNQRWNAEKTFTARLGRAAGLAGRGAALAFVAYNGYEAISNAYDDTWAGRNAFATFFDASQSLFTGHTWAEMQTPPGAPKPVDPYANDGYCVKK